MTMTTKEFLTFEFMEESNKLNDLMLNLTPENTTQHSRIE